MAARHVGVAMDFSAGSKYDLSWALNNIVRDGDCLLLVVVKKKSIDSGEMHLWDDTGSPLIPLLDFAEPSKVIKYGVTLDDELLTLLQHGAQQKQLILALKVYWGDAREKICEAVVDLSLDCIIMGSRGLGMLKRALLGSVSNYVLNNAACPVTVVKLPTHQST